MFGFSHLKLKCAKPATWSFIKIWVRSFTSRKKSLIVTEEEEEAAAADETGSDDVSNY